MSYQDYRDIVDFVFTKPEEAEKIYSSPPNQKEFNEKQSYFKPYFNEEILKLKSPQETTLRDYRVRLGMVSFPDTNEDDKIKKKKTSIWNFYSSEAYHIWKNSMQSIDTVELESTNGGGFFF